MSSIIHHHLFDPRCIQGLTFFLAYSIFSAVLGMLQFGYNTGVINAPEQVLVNMIMMKLVMVMKMTKVMAVINARMKKRTQSLKFIAL